MKKLFCIALVLLLTACAPKAIKIDKQPDENYLIGVSLKENGYRFKINSNSELALSPTELMAKNEGNEPPSATTYVSSTSFKEPSSPMYAHSFLGEIQSVFVRMQKEDAFLQPFDGVNVLNFQVFEKSEFKQGKYAKVLTKNVPYEALLNRVIYENDLYVVVDETDYFLVDTRGEPMSTEEYLWQKWPNGHPDLDYALAIRDYVLSNMDIFLTQVA